MFQQVYLCLRKTSPSPYTNVGYLQSAVAWKAGKTFILYLRVEVTWVTIFYQNVLNLEIDTNK